MAIRHYVYAAGIAAGLALLVACADEVTEVTNVRGTVKLEEVKKFKELPKCEEDAEGSLVYVKDSAKVFVCTDDGWELLDGKDGEDGKDGKDGSDGKDGKEGSSCIAKQNKKKTGFDIVCDGKTVGSIENGSDGEAGKAGNAGSMNCTAKQNKNKTGFDFVCDGKTMGTVLNGDDGEGCSLADGKNGEVTVTCGEKSVSIFRASCGKAFFDPTTHFCASDENVYPLCSRAPEGKDYYLHSDGTYNVMAYFCDVTDIVLPKCEGQTYDYTTQFCGVNYAGAVRRCNEVSEGVDASALDEENGTYDTEGFFCTDNGVLYAKCGGETYDPELQFCKDDKVQSL